MWARQLHGRIHLHVRQRMEWRSLRSRSVHCFVGVHSVICLLVAICNTTCGEGYCSAPDTCTCHGHWAGEQCDSCAEGWEAFNCSTPICSADCDHGTCTTPGTCTCLPHWTGPTCNLCTSGWNGNDCNTGRRFSSFISSLTRYFSHLPARMPKRNVRKFTEYMHM